MAVQYLERSLKIIKITLYERAYIGVKNSFCKKKIFEWRYQWVYTGMRKKFLTHLFFFYNT